MSNVSHVQKAQYKLFKHGRLKFMFLGFAGNALNQQKYQNRKLFMQAMIALVHTFMSQPFVCITKSKLEGSALLNVTCDDLLADMKAKRKNDDWSHKENSQWIDEVNTSIIVLLSVIFSELFYRIQDDEQGFPATGAAKVIFEELLSEYTHTETYKKIIGLNSLMGQSPEKTRQTLIGNFYLKMDIFIQIMQLPFVEKTMADLIDLLGQGRKIPKSQVIDILRKNKT